MITRHAERNPDGSLTSEGVASAKEKGKSLAGDAEVVKAYTSDEKSGRTKKTGDLISQESDTISVTGRPYATRSETGIQYDVLQPDLTADLKEATALIDKATVEELGLPPGTKLDALPKDEQERIAPVRMKNQRLGFLKALENPALVHRMAMGLAHQLMRELEIASRYHRSRQHFENSPEDDVVLNTVTHGLFVESLLREAGTVVREGEEPAPISDFESEEFGGFIQPAESVFLDVEDPSSMPERIPVSFEASERPQSGRVFLDRVKIEALAEEYKAWKQSSAEKK